VESQDRTAPRALASPGRDPLRRRRRRIPSRSRRSAATRPTADLAPTVRPPRVRGAPEPRPPRSLDRASRSDGPRNPWTRFAQYLVPGHPTGPPRAGTLAGSRFRGCLDARNPRGRCQSGSCSCRSAWRGKSRLELPRPLRRRFGVADCSSPQRSVRHSRLEAEEQGAEKWADNGHSPGYRLVVLLLRPPCCPMTVQYGESGFVRAFMGTRAPVDDCP
jgi:hypothetical protein